MNIALRRTLIAGAFLSAVSLAPRADAQVVISQVYGGGGSSQAAASYQNDFIELYNNGLTTIDLTGFSVQYSSATSTTSPVTLISSLTGTIASHDYFLIQTGSAGTGGAVLPNGPGGFAYNGTASLNLSASSGKVFLCSNSNGATFTVASTTPVFVPSTFSANVLDEVGYGTANAYEGTGPAPGQSISLSDSRTLTAGVYTDTNNNGVDFASVAPTPHVGAYNPAVAPAPEPSGIVALALGMGVLGLMATRRRMVGA